MREHRHFADHLLRNHMVQAFEFVREVLQMAQLVQVVTVALSTAPSSSRQARLRCIAAMAQDQYLQHPHNQGVLGHLSHAGTLHLLLLEAEERYQLQVTQSLGSVLHLHNQSRLRGC